jgi:hypothetical protein
MMRVGAVFVGMLVALSSVSAQGALSTQGFGYPPGQFSSRALGTGGGLAPFDPQSTVNPASAAISGDPVLFLQYEPEFRRLTSGNVTQHTTTSRFPLAVASVPVGSQGTIALSVSTLLDRSWETTTTRDQIVAGTPATTTEVVKSIGAINDVRLVGGWANSRVQIGVGGHVFTGQNRLYFTQTFPDSLHFVGVNQLSSLDYTGFAVSGGVIIHPSSVFALALSGRKGGNLRARSSDTLVASAKIPDRYGAGIFFSGIPGATVSAQISRDRWSALNGLGSTDADATDAWDSGVGIEATGPRLFERVVLLRLGARYRTLPFPAGGAQVREVAFAGGLGAQFSRNRASLDVTLQSASRSAPDASGSVGDIRERAYTLSFGLRVRP